MHSFLNRIRLSNVAIAFTTGVVLSGLAVIGLLMFSVTGNAFTNAAAASDTNYTAIANAPSTMLVNATTPFSAAFSAVQSQPGLNIDVEIYNSSNQQVYQYVQSNQSLSTAPNYYNWNWKPTTPGTYTIKLGIFSNNWSTTLYWNDAAASFSVTSPTATMNADLAPSTSWGNLPFYIDPYNDATNYYKTNPYAYGASEIEREGATATADWFGDWDSNVQASANSYVTAAASANATPILVLYNIPNRDCGGYSAGGAENESDYISWVQQVANGIGSKQAVVILEPDALAGLDCLSPADQQTRYSELSQAVSILKDNSNTHVYLDAGHPGWQSASVIAQRLQQANIAAADGFSLNISNFVSTSTNEAYGAQVSAMVGGKHFLIDTSRNGNGAPADGEWCNPAGMAIGQTPTTYTGDGLVDAFIWAKGPWGSDGPCNGGPAAGQDFWAYAIQLAENADW